MAKQSLGRGFDSLIPKDLDRTILEEDKSRVQKLLITDIVPNPEQPRSDHSPEKHNELVASVKLHGVLQPIIVVRHGDGYRIVAGERRWRAAKAAGHKNIPAIVRSLEELEQVELAIIENIQRVDLSPLEQAMAVYKLQQQFNLALEQIAVKLGKAPSTISNISRLLQLPKKAREALKSRRISEGHARAILALKNHPKKQEELLSSILNNVWTVRQAEQFVSGVKSGARRDEAVERTVAETPTSKVLAKKLGVPVKIRHTANGVHLIIHLKDVSDIEKIAEKLGGST